MEMLMNNEVNGENKISYIIDTICSKYNIFYKSKNANYNEIKKDALKLVDIYLQLKQIIAELIILEEKYKIDGLKQLLEDDIKKLDSIDHDLIKISKELRNK